MVITQATIAESFARGLHEEFQKIFLVNRGWDVLVHPGSDHPENVNWYAQIYSPGGDYGGQTYLTFDCDGAMVEMRDSARAFDMACGWLIEQECLRFDVAAPDVLKQVVMAAKRRFGMV
jgi:hypothetical protein